MPESTYYKTEGHYKSSLKLSQCFGLIEIFQTVCYHHEGKGCSCPATTFFQNLAKKGRFEIRWKSEKLPEDSERLLNQLLQSPAKKKLSQMPKEVLMIDIIKGSSSSISSKHCHKSLPGNRSREQVASAGPHL